MNTMFPLTLALFCALGERIWAQENLLPQGNFANPGANTGWAEGFKVPNNQEFRVVSERGSTGCASRTVTLAASLTTCMPM